MYRKRYHTTGHSIWLTGGLWVFDRCSAETPQRWLLKGFSDFTGHIYRSSRYSQKKTIFRWGLEHRQNVWFFTFTSNINERGGWFIHQPQKLAHCFIFNGLTQTVWHSLQEQNSPSSLMKSQQHNEAEESQTAPQNLSVYLLHFIWQGFFFFCVCMMHTVLWQVWALLQPERSKERESKHTAVVA